VSLLDGSGDLCVFTDTAADFLLDVTGYLT
jgi:hypothetical protein